MVADMVAFVASQFTTSTWDVGAEELCSVVLIFINTGVAGSILSSMFSFSFCVISIILISGLSLSREIWFFSN